MTYLRQNLHDQVKILEKDAFSLSSIISLANAKSPCKIHFGHKNFICSRIFNFFQVLLGQTKIKILTWKYFFCRPPYKNFLRKTIIRDKFSDYKCVVFVIFKNEENSN